ncbi:MAG TPA: NADH-quinone oxidoreductase subunit M [Candidatus Thermoplasmatota archaeon]|nr:NADH-quinone oxidoreductase subunit M [Candidatus Thermoplasmatota archaeon]
MDIPGLIPYTLLVTLAGALVTFRASDRTSRLVALAFSLPALAATTWMFWQTGFSGSLGANAYRFTVDWTWIPAIGARLQFGVDGLSASLAWLTALLTPLVILYSWHEGRRPRFFFALLLLLDATVIGVFTSLDLFLFYVFWEFVLVPMYFLIAVWGGANRKYASQKFFIYTGGASLVMLLGFMALYFGAGLNSLSIPVLTSVGAHVGFAKDFALLAFALLGVGFLVKMPSVPFHTWLPDAHVQAPTAGSVMLAGVLLKMGSYGLMRIALPILGSSFTAMNHVALGPLSFDWSYQWVFYVLGTASVVYGAFLCLAQDDLKSLIAYSSVSHMGMITLALASLTPLGFAGAAFMNVAHGVISAGMFMAAGSLQHATGTRLISKLGGIGPRVPRLTGLTLTLFLASLGLPGLMGFIAEFTIFAGVWQAFHWWILIPIWSILITAGYYLWAMQRAYFGPERRHPDVDWAHLHDVPATEKWSMAALIGLALLFGILPGLLLGQMDGWTVGVLGLLGGGA